MAAVRRRRRRRGILLSHGFALRASPAVKHGVSPPGTVGEHAMPLGIEYAIRVWARILMGFSGAIRMRVERIRVRAERLMKFPNAIRALANRISVRMDRLILFFSAIKTWTDAIRVRADRIRVRVDRLIGISGVIRIFTFSRKRSLQKMVREGFRSFSEQDMCLIITRLLYKKPLLKLHWMIFSRGNHTFSGFYCAESMGKWRFWSCKNPQHLFERCCG